MDEVDSDAFDLTSLLRSDDGDDPSGSETEAAYEMFLGQLVFSANDPRIDIMDNYDLCADPLWLTWLDRKINTTRDVEEKMALGDLRGECRQPAVSRQHAHHHCLSLLMRRVSHHHAVSPLLCIADRWAQT